MALELNVWLFAERVGTLALIDGRLNFSYKPNWLSHPNAVALSASLPLQAQPYDDRKTRPFFAGLLPEGQMRRLIAQHVQVSDQNDFALLDHIGGECAGAMTKAPGAAKVTPDPRNFYVLRYPHRIPLRIVEFVVQLQRAKTGLKRSRRSVRPSNPPAGLRALPAWKRKFTNVQLK